MVTGNGSPPPAPYPTAGAVLGGARVGRTASNAQAVLVPQTVDVQHHTVLQLCYVKKPSKSQTGVPACRTEAITLGRTSTRKRQTRDYQEASTR